MARHNELGEKGEQMALDVLVKKGYELLDRNWRSGRNELDLIMRIGSTVVFVEVKTRATAFFGEPIEHISPAQQQRIIQAANDYLEEKELALEARFDVVSIVLNEKQTLVEHIEDAFYPMA